MDTTRCAIPYGLPIFILVAFSLGLGLMLSTLAVYFPDVAEMYQIILAAWMYMTPIFYPESILPEMLAYQYIGSARCRRTRADAPAGQVSIAHG